MLVFLRSKSYYRYSSTTLSDPDREMALVRRPCQIAQKYLADERKVLVSCGWSFDSFLATELGV